MYSRVKSINLFHLGKHLEEHVDHLGNALEDPIGCFGTKMKFKWQHHIQK